MAQDSTAARRAVGVISLGCPKNLVDTEVMLGRLQAAGFQIVADPTRADVLLVNTCCFIAPAREEAAEALAEAAEWRRGEAGRILICAGCWPEMDAAHLRERFPEIDALMGPGDVADVVSIVERACKGGGAQAPASPPAHYLHDEGNPRLLSTPPWTAYVKIAEGCSHRCAFCTIPSLRGPYRSRSPDAVLLEARNLVARGVKELNLVAQDTTAYAADEGQTDIANLLARLGDLEGLTWVRLLYAHPTTVSDRLIEVMASHDRVCDYLDVPFQHSAGSVLRKMGRPGDGDAFLRLIARLRQAMPDVAIRSTFLLGFPGETDEEFQDLLDFIEAAQLDRAGAFCYSRERGTRAAELPTHVPTETAQARFHEFMVRQQSISLARNERWVGRDLEVLVETKGERPGQWLGRSFRDAPEIDGTVQIIAERRALSLGQFARVRVTGAEPYDLMGELPSPRSARRRTTRPAG